MSMLPGGRFDKTRITPPSTTKVSDVEVRRARLFVASVATDVGDCADLLGMLGIGPTEEEIAEQRRADGTQEPVPPAATDAGAAITRGPDR